MEQYDTSVNEMRRMVEYQKHALSHRVLTVAVLNYDDGELFDWAVYVDAVKGDNHDREMEEVARSGNKSRIEEAAVFFPHIDIEKYRG